VLLRPLVAAITKIQAGTDKTAAELALARLRDELKELEHKRSLLIQASDAAIAEVCNRGVFWLTYGVVWLLFVGLGYWFLGLAVGFLVAITVQGYFDNRAQERLRAALPSHLRSIDAEIAAIKERMKGHRATIEA
jgi:Flp pilus assembly protein TadB